MPQPSDATPDDVGWFDELFTAHYADLYRFAVRRTSCQQDAEDLVAETLMVTWRRRGDLPPDDQLRLWLFGTARLILQNQWRSTRRRRKLLDRLRTATPLPAVDTMPAAVVDTDAGQALQRLATKDREVLILAAWEGLTAPEIAVVLDITPDTARKRLERARRRLRAALHIDPTCTTPLTAQEAGR